MKISSRSGEVKLGLRANWQQFWLLVLINAFVGAMVGLERTVVPLIAEVDFGLVSKTVILSFIISFGQEAQLIHRLQRIIPGNPLSPKFCC